MVCLYLALWASRAYPYANPKSLWQRSWLGISYKKVNVGDVGLGLFFRLELGLRGFGVSGYD